MTQSSPPDIILHKRSPLINKRPLVSDLGKGAIAINYHEDDVSMFIVDREDNVRKIGGIWYGATAPDPTVVGSGWQTLSHGEVWVKQTAIPGSSDPNTGAEIFIWNKYLNSGSGDWVLAGGGFFSILDDYLDQFKDGTDGSDYIHTDRNQLKINNKSALRGYATTIPSDDETDITKANTLVINDQHNFATGVTLNANSLVIDSTSIKASSDGIALNADSPYTFQTDSASGASETTFTYNGHGLFNGEEVFVTEFLNDGVTNSGVASGNYTIAQASLNTFKLFDGSANMLATGNVKINYSPQLLLDRKYNVTQSGNFKIKGLSELPDDSQIDEGRWDLYQNTSNGNVRIFSRVNNKLTQPDSAVISVPAKNSGTATLLAGTPVYFTGRDPIKKIVTVDKADPADELKMRAIGVIQSDVAANAVGDITIFGSLKIDTSSLDGATTGDDSGRVVFVKSGGGLTLTQPDFNTNEVQEIGVLFQESATDGEIFVNHPETLFGLPPLPDDYIWVGDVNNEAVAKRLNSDSFKQLVLSGVPEIALADEIKFGAYEFLWDQGDPRSRTQTKVTTSDVASTSGLAQAIDVFSTNYRSAKFFVQLASVSAGAEVAWQITELLVIHDGTDVSVVDYGTAAIGGGRMGDFSGDVVGSEVQIKFTPYDSAEGELVIKVLRTAVLS